MTAITVTQKGSFANTERYLNRLRNGQIFKALSKYGSIGQNALSNATPVESGETAASWTYEIVQRPGYYSIRWGNNHIEDGVNIAVILDYGHGTGTGGYVQGREYIMPAIRPIFDDILAEVIREVSRL